MNGASQPRPGSIHRPFIIKPDGRIGTIEEYQPETDILIEGQ